MLIGCAPGAAATSGELTESHAHAADGTPTIELAADWSESVTGELVAGGEVELIYDAARLPKCRGTQGGIAQWAITGFWRIDDGPISTVALAGLNAPALPPTIALPESGDLELWFQNTNVWGCNAYDSSWGNNYHYSVVDSPGAPGWVGNAASVVSRWTCGSGPCDADRQPLDDGFVFGTWARQRAFIAAVYFDVWKEDVTDWDNPDLWKQLDVQVHTRLAGASAFTSSYVDYDHRVGNDARYAVPIRPIDPLGGSTIVDPADCPEAELTVTADGQYVRTTMELYFTVNGTELRPSPDTSYTGVFEDYLGLYTPCLP
jgi:hypothetical protein